MKKKKKRVSGQEPLVKAVFCRGFNVAGGNPYPEGRDALRGKEGSPKKGVAGLIPKKRKNFCRKNVRAERGI